MNKQEQIEEMAKKMPAKIKDPLDNSRYIIFGKSLRREIARIYYNAGYRNVSEYRAERELLGSQIKVLEQRLNDKYIEVDNLNRDYHNSFERLKAQGREIERLKAENARLTGRLGQVLLAVDTVKEMNAMCDIDDQRKQAVKEFAEKLKERMGERDYMGVKYKQGVFSENDIDELLKEYDK